MKTDTPQERMEQIHQGFDWWLKKADPHNLFVTSHGFAREAWQDALLSERGEKLYTKADAEALCEIAKAAGIKLAREATLEECAKLAEERYAEVAWHPDYRIAASSIAFTIRKLKVTA